MNIFQLVLKQMRQRALSTWLTLLSVTLGVGLAMVTFGYAVGLDMTRRDIQSEAKKLARPWELSKGFDQSCPISPIRTAAKIGHPTRGRIEVSVNGKVQQTGDLSQMIWNVPESIAYLSRFVALAPGDLIMTGTPAGVSAVKPGDSLHGTCEAVGEVDVTYAAR